MGIALPCGFKDAIVSLCEQVFSASNNAVGLEADSMNTKLLKAIRVQLSLYRDAVGLSQ